MPLLFVVLEGEIVLKPTEIISNRATGLIIIEESETGLRALQIEVASSDEELGLLNRLVGVTKRGNVNKPSVRYVLHLTEETIDKITDLLHSSFSRVIKAVK